MKVFFVTYGGGHVNMVAPVARELARQGADCRVMALTTGHLKARQLGLQPLGYRDFMDLVAEPERVLQWGRELADGNAHPDVDPTESLCYLGVNFAQWVKDHGEEGARQMYREKGRGGFYPLDFMREMLRRVRPDVVVTTNSPRSEAAAVEAARSLSIPVLSMIDLFVKATDDFCRRSVFADRLTVISGAVKHVLEAVGIAPDRIAVTGNPAFDTLLSAEVREQALAFRRERGWMGQRVILFAGHGETTAGTPPQWRGPGFATQVQEWLQGWVKAHEGDALVVRYHPSDSHLYPPLPDEACFYRSEPLREPLHPLLLAADVVVVQISTVGLEASLSGRRVLCLRFAPSAQWVAPNYADLGLAEGIDSLDDLGRALDSAEASLRIDPAEYMVGEATRNVATEVAGLAAVDQAGSRRKNNWPSKGDGDVSPVR